MNQPRMNQPERTNKNNRRRKAERAAGTKPAAFASVPKAGKAASKAFAPAAKAGKAEVVCPVAQQCGGCDLQGVPYAQQLKAKDRTVRRLLGSLAGTIRPITGAEQPQHYRCKVNAAFGYDRRGRIVCGPYAAHSHRIVPVEACRIEDEQADAMIRTICSLAKTFRLRPYNEDTGSGFLRHVQVRRGYATDQYMVVLVCAGSMLPSRQRFVQALISAHPKITTILLNVNDRKTSMVLGKRSIVLYGQGWIEDALCGCTFRISPTSFYQVNPPQAQRLYEAALELAHLTGRETVLDAYCGTGTIGIIASAGAGQVLGVELNREAVQDAVWNAKRNKIRNIRFVCADAGEYISRMREAPDVVILDPPRSGTTPQFIGALTRLRPKRIIYISCGIESLARDLKLFQKQGWQAEEVRPFDLFPYASEHIECVVALSGRH